MPDVAPFEGLGVFYLGKEADPDTKDLGNAVLYDSAELTTHAFIVGMTGSGKTGLGVGLIEEAAPDKIPVIAIDPKGDLGNLALAFPDLAPRDFRPLIDEGEATREGIEADDLDLTMSPETKALETVAIQATQTDIYIAEMALAWMPYQRDADGRLVRA